MGEMGLAYDAEADLVVLIAREVVPEGGNPDNVSVVRFWCTRVQLRAMCHWAIEISARGRPLCSQCGQPMDPEGHFCPKKNGNRH